MDIELVRNFFSGLRYSNLTHVNIIWHGGEPILRGLEFFEEIILLEKEITSISFSNGIQTNGTLISDELCNFFVENNFTIGISLDGHQELNDSHRTFKGGKSSFDKVINTIQLLKKYKVNFGIISVLSNSTLNKTNPESLISFFEKIGIKELSFNSIDRFENLVCTHTASKLSQFLITIYDILKDSESCLNVREINDPISKLMGLGGISYCRTMKDFCGDHFHGIKENGDVVLCCDKFMTSNKEWAVIGNIKINSILEIISTSYHLNILEKLRAKRNECVSNCSAANYCNGYCISDRLDKTSDNNLSVGCITRNNLFKHVQNDFNMTSNRASKNHYE
jgi:uncharacterized protein